MLCRQLASKVLAQSPGMVARVGVEPSTLRTEGAELYYVKITKKYNFNVFPNLILGCYESRVS